MAEKVTGVPFNNGPTCEGVSFAFPGAPHDISHVIISGRYPEEGWAMNEVSHEVVSVKTGLGTLALKNGEVTQLRAGDAVEVKPGEWFAWEGHLQLVMSCYPPFDPAQYKVEES